MEVVLFCYDTDSYELPAPRDGSPARTRFRLWGRTPAGEPVVVYVDDFDARFRIAPAPSDREPRRVAEIAERVANMQRYRGATVGSLRRTAYPFHCYVEQPYATWDVTVPWSCLHSFLREFAYQWKSIRGEIPRPRAAGAAEAAEASPSVYKVATPLVMGLHRNRAIAFHSHTGTAPGTWIRVRGASRSSAGHAREGVVEYEAQAADVAPAGGAFDDAPPSVVMAFFDIEAVSAPGTNRFPDPSEPEDRAIQISVVVAALGEPEPRLRAVGVLGECDPLPDCEIVAFPEGGGGAGGADRAEAALLEWFVRAVSGADLLVGYNSSGFDLPFLAKRSTLLRARGATPHDWIRRLGKDARDIDYDDEREMRGRLLGPEDRARRAGGAQPKDKKRVRSDYSQRVTAGLVHFDLHQEIRTDTGLRGFVPSLKLGVISTYFLGETKEDLDYAMIPVLHRTGGPAGRARIASYCLQDSVLVHRIAGKRGSVGKAFALCRETGVPLSLIQFGGSTVRGISLLDRYGKKRSPPVLITQPLAALAGRDVDPPAAAPAPGAPGPADGGAFDEELGDATADDGDEDEDDEAEPDKYEGAFVISPMIGRYGNPVVVLDYNSLYPSSMRTFGLCPSLYRGCGRRIETDAGTGGRFVRVGRDVFREEDHVLADTGHKVHVFRRDPSETRGIVPNIVAQLVAARKAVRKRAEELDPKAPQAQVLDALQLAIKIVANSLYGIFGAKFGSVACRPVAESTTAFGREAIRTAMRCACDSFPGDAKVAYGDTDSIFVTFTARVSVEEAFRRGAVIEGAINAANRAAGRRFLNIELEKLFFPFAIAGKKTYAGDKHTLGRGGRIDRKRAISGFQAVKRSALPASAELQRAIIDALLDARSDPRDAVRVAVEEVLYRVWCIHSGYFSLADIQLRQKNNGATFATDPKTGARALVRGPYASDSQPILQLMKKMDARVAGSAPGSGSYLHYVVLRASSAAQKVGEREEEPLWLVRGAAEPDVDRPYYARKIAADGAAVLRCALLELGDPWHDKLDAFDHREERARKKVELEARRAREAGERLRRAAEREAKKRAREEAAASGATPGKRRKAAAAAVKVGPMDAFLLRAPAPPPPPPAEPEPEPEPAPAPPPPPPPPAPADDEEPAAAAAPPAAPGADVTPEQAAAERKKKSGELCRRLCEFVTSDEPADLCVELRGNGGQGTWVRSDREHVVPATFLREEGETLVAARAADRTALFDRFRDRLARECRRALRESWASDARALGIEAPDGGAPIPLPADARRKILFELHAGGDNRWFFVRPALEGILRHLEERVPLRTTLPPEEAWDGGAWLERAGVLAPAPAPVPPAAA